MTDKNLSETSEMLEYDAVIIGAGIQGCGIAEALAKRGKRVLVVEKTAVAAGTSSQSSKLIHGGLRYLESGQFSLVKESLRDRDFLLKTAPDLVKLVPFYIPIYKNSKRKPWQIYCGLQLYRWLSGFSKHGNFTKLAKEQWQQLDGLVTKDLLAVFRYFDGQTDDAALTKSVLESAKKLGAEICLPAEIQHIEIIDNGCKVKISTLAQTVKCKTVINCTGPWAAMFQEKHLPQLLPLNIELVQGTHLLIDDNLTQGIYYLESPDDGRAVFAMPWQGNLLLGTTETPYRGDPEQVKPLLSEQEYLANTFKHYFPEHPNNAVIKQFCGLRVLPAEDKNPFSRSREVMIEKDRKQHPRVITILGGKLTTYRSTAEKVCAELQHLLT